MGPWLVERLLFLVVAIVAWALAGRSKEDWAFFLRRRREFAAAEAAGRIVPFVERERFTVFVRGFFWRSALWAVVAVWFVLRIAPFVAPFTGPLFGRPSSGCSP